MKKLANLTIFVFIAVSFLASEITKFEDIKIRRHKSADKRQLVDKIGVLSFDEDARKLTFQSEAGITPPFHIPTSQKPSSTPMPI